MHPSSSAHHVLQSLKGLRAQNPIIGCPDQVAAKAKAMLYESVDREKALSV
jgi:hypothetical protein